MKHFAGLDVSLEATSVCVVDEVGQIVEEAKVLSEPDALVVIFGELDVQVTRICLEAGGTIGAVMPPAGPASEPPRQSTGITLVTISESGSGSASGARVVSLFSSIEAQGSLSH